MKTMTFETARFGTIDYIEDDVVAMQGGLVGFPNLLTFVLLQHKEGSPFRWLQCLEENSVAFLVVDPGNFVANYAPEIPDSWIESLEIQEETPRLVYTIVSIPPGKPEEMTLNLAGPIVINLVNRRAKQIVLEDERYPIKHRAFEAAQRVPAAA